MSFQLITISLIVLFAVLLIIISGMIRYIPNDRLGVLEKLWSFNGSIKNGLIALRGEAGFQPEVVRGGFHFFMPFQYRLHAVPLVTVPQGQIGYVYARDGQPLPPSQTLAANDNGVDFQDVRAFLQAGGQKGPQRKILREGTYAINLANFVVLTKERRYAISMEKSDAQLFEEMGHIIQSRSGFEPIVIKDADDCIGIVTVHDGPSLPQGEIIAPAVGNDPMRPATFHNNFQEPEKFLHAAGFRGRQYQVLVDGSYYLNRLFATVELVKKTIIEVGTVGVVVSYTMPAGLAPTSASKRSEPTTCQVEPLASTICISCSRVALRISLGKASSMRRRPVCGLTESQIALRACAYSGSICQYPATRSKAATAVRCRQISSLPLRRCQTSSACRPPPCKYRHAGSW